MAQPCRWLTDFAQLLRWLQAALQQELGPYHKRPSSRRYVQWVEGHRLPPHGLLGQPCSTSFRMVSFPQLPACFLFCGILASIPLAFPPSLPEGEEWLTGCWAGTAWDFRIIWSC